MKQKQREAMIAEVMENFDFEKVHKVMEYLDWKWSIGHDENVVPSVYRLMKQAEKMLDDVSRNDDGMRIELSTGGLRAVFDENEDLELRFEIELNTSCSEDYDEEGCNIYNG